jgi:hypothetical protein
MKRTPLRKVSKKRAIQNRAYMKIRKQFLEDAPFCEVPDCYGFSREIHHSNHREGVKLLDRKYFVAVCRNCHRKIHDNPKWAREKGLLK